MNPEQEKAWFSWIPAMPPPAVLLITLLFNLRFFQQAATKHWEPPPYWRTARELLQPELMSAAKLPLANLVFLTENLILILLTAALKTLLTVNHYFPDSMGILALTLLNREVIYMFMTMKYHRQKNAESEDKGEAKAEDRFRQWFEENKSQLPANLPPPPFRNGSQNSA